MPTNCWSEKGNIKMYVKEYYSLYCVCVCVCVCVCYKTTGKIIVIYILIFKFLVAIQKFKDQDI